MIVAFDLETALTTGEPSVEFHRPDFRAVSAAFVWETGSKVCVGETEIRSFLKLIEKHNHELVVHNLAFEYGVMTTRFPGYEHLVKYDTARLTQITDNGGRFEYDDSQSVDSLLAELEGETRSTGLSLQSCVSRWLPSNYHSHKAPFHALIRERSGIEGKEGSRLNYLTPEELLEYNKLDAEVTLELFKVLTLEIAKRGIEWRLDHALYSSSARLIAGSKVRGVAVDRAKLAVHLEAKEHALEEIGAAFRTQFKPQLDKLEDRYTSKERDKRKTELGKNSVVPVEFNTRSTKQLADLFVGELGIKPTFFTAKGAPSFKAKFMNQWGEGGQILKKQRTHMLEHKQAERLMEKSEFDGRWHVDLRATGTKTNRFAGAGGLNVQGLSRRCESLMSCLVADPGETIVSIDLSAGEPTVTTHYSQDPNYYAANFGMVGKEPYYKDKMLMISDIYLMTASVSPIGSDKVLEAFNTTWNGKTFQEQWLEDDEVIKGELKGTVRNLHKVLCLGLSYGMGPKKLVQTAYEAGYSITPAQAKAFFNTYWKTFFKVKMLGDYLARTYKRQGYLQTAFGYCVYPDADYKALNAFIQASVSGIMHSLNAKFFEDNDHSRFITVIHDEDLLAVKTAQLELARTDWNAAVEWLNRSLGWEVNIRTGWKEGQDWYTAK